MSLSSLYLSHRLHPALYFKSWPVDSASIKWAQAEKICKQSKHQHQVRSAFKQDSQFGVLKPKIEYQKNDRLKTKISLILSVTNCLTSQNQIWSAVVKINFQNTLNTI